MVVNKSLEKFEKCFFSAIPQNDLARKFKSVYCNPAFGLRDMQIHKTTTYHKTVYRMYFPKTFANFTKFSVFGNFKM